MDVAVIGAGISGLVTAYRLKQSGKNVVLFEASDRVGGNIRSEVREGFLIEHGPNSLLSTGPIYDLITDLGILDQVEPPDPLAKNRYIVRNGRMTALPARLTDLLTTGAFSAKGRLRLLKDLFTNSRSRADESVAAFFERHLGREIVKYAVDPFISGIYAGDPNKLSAASAFPRIYEYERKYGSVLRGLLSSSKSKEGKAPKGFPRSFSFEQGVETLTKAIGERLGPYLHLETPIVSIEKGGGGYEVTAISGEKFRSDAVVISTPAAAAGSLLKKLEVPVSEELASIYYSPIAVVFAGFRHDQVAVHPNGFGVLAPEIEARRILGSLFTSSVFENRAPDGYHLFTIFIGGSRNSSLCENSEVELINIGVEEISQLLRIEGTPSFAAVRKWERAIPQYNIGYEKIVASIDRFKGSHRGVFFASNFYKGISVGDCVNNAGLTTAEVLEFLRVPQH